MAVVPFLGLRATDSWGANERPEDWREAILWYFPNGDVSLTALTALLGSERTYDPKFHWFEQEFPTQGGAIAGIFTNSTLVTAYSGDAYTEGQMVFVQVSEVLAQEFRVGMNARLCDTDRPTAETLSKVVDRVLNGANSYLACRLLENAGASPALDNVDQVQAAGDQNPLIREIHVNSLCMILYAAHTACFAKISGTAQPVRKTRTG